jgi:hypothetical protein
MDSVVPDWFWFWFGLFVVVVVRALAASSMGILCALSTLGHHSSRRDCTRRVKQVRPADSTEMAASQAAAGTVDSK